VLLWAPAYLERVAGFQPATAATVAAGFFVGVLAGRIALRGLVRTLTPQTILFSAFATGVVGFGLYWGVGAPWAAIAGMVLLGLCVAPLYPVAMALGIGAANGANDAASARLTLAFGIALLVAPATLGAFADVVGLSLAHLTLPALIAATLVSFLAAGMLERRVIQPA
jgi:fucose permease